MRLSYTFSTNNKVRIDEEEKEKRPWWIKSLFCLSKPEFFWTELLCVNFFFIIMFKGFVFISCLLLCLLNITYKSIAFITLIWAKNNLEETYVFLPWTASYYIRGNTAQKIKFSSKDFFIFCAVKIYFNEYCNLVEGKSICVM